MATGYFKLSILVMIVLLTGCATTDQGKSVERAQWADIGSTAWALTQDGLTEGNPLGAAVLPVKLGLGWYTEHYIKSCKKRAEFARKANSVTYGFTANNLLRIAGIGDAALAGGLITGIVYWIYYKSLEPNAFTCNEDVYEVEQ